MKDIVKSIEKFAREHYSNDDLHGIGHVLRVLENAKKIHAIEEGNWQIIEIIVWLHDIGRSREEIEKKHHATLSNEMSMEFLHTSSIDDATIKLISEGILQHSFSVGGIAQSIEAKIVSDADKLDALGAIGIFRTCAYQHDHNQGINDVLAHFHEKLYKLPGKMYLEESKKIAQSRIAVLRDYEKNTIHELKRTNSK